MVARIRTALNLRPAIGMATTQFVAARAAHVAGAGAAVVVPPGQEQAFLAPQPITALPIDAEVIRRLHLLGLRTLGAVAAIPRDAMAAQFGAAGFHIHCLAQGMDDQPVAWLLGLNPTFVSPATPEFKRFDYCALDTDIS
jgi:DNA polymerase IV